MFKRIKLEIFLLIRLIQEGYFPRYFKSYFKNRFLGQRMIDSIHRIEGKPVEDFELHIVCQQRDAWMMAAALQSFIKNSGINPKIVLHDDGTMKEGTIHILKSKFSNLTVIRRGEADNRIEKTPELSSKVKFFRANGHALLLKFIDVLIYSSSKKVMVLDSDVLFYKKPDELVNFIYNQNSVKALVSKNHSSWDLKASELLRRNLEEKMANYINTGIIIFDRTVITLEMLNEFFENIDDNPKEYLLEMTGWAFILARIGFDFLPIERYHIKGKITSQTVAKHFTSSRRYELYAYGIDQALS